jgi:aminoglycoside phosphotransferase (APT) family kinase protein
MPRNIQLLKQVRSVTTQLNHAIDNPDTKVLISIADLFLNELMQREETGFYIDFLKRGKALLADGIKLAAAQSQTVTTPELRDDLNDESRIEAIDREIALLYEALFSVARVLDENRSAAEKAWLVNVTAWECSLSTRRLQQVASAAKTEAKAIIVDVVEAYLQKKFPEWKGLKVTKFVTVEGGLSKKTILFETDDVLNGHQSLVIRAEQPVTMLFFDGSDVTQEYYVIALMHKLGMPVPKPLWLEADASHLGVRFLVTTRAEGATYFTGLGSIARNEALPPEVVKSYLQWFYKMHALKPDPNDPLVQHGHLNEWMPHKTIREVTRYNAAVYVPKLVSRAGIQITPQLHRVLRWLENNAPDSDDPPVLVHVDYAFNNLLFKDNRVTAILDWETSRMGDPADDIIWTQYNLGVYSMPEFLKVYEKATGRHISEYRIAYARVQKCVLNLIAGLTSLEAIDADDNAPPHMGMMAFKYTPLFGANAGELIVEAEKLRGR